MIDGRDLRVHLYGDGEFMLGYGPQNGPQLLVLQPLFEEMNRCRAFIVSICRRLAEHGIGCWLPDLPGTGESLRALETVDWHDWQQAVRSAAALVVSQSGTAPATIAFRGGALLDDLADKRWCLAPTSGRSLLGDLRRSALVRGEDDTAPAGYRLSIGLTQALEAAVPLNSARTIRLTSDDRPADLHVDGSPLWRRPEPAGDTALAHALADDIQEWARA